MRSRVILWVALAANLLLALGWFWSTRQLKFRLTREAILAEAGSTRIKTNVVIRRQYFSWQEVESDDYPTYITHLRDIGCPEQTIRDIIVADVNSLYARKRALEIITPDQQWWRSEPDTNLQAIAAAKIRELDQERRDLLTTLLGPNWEGGDLVSLPRPSRTPISLDGPVLGVLPNDVKQTVQQINARLQDRIQEYAESQRRAGKTPDPAEIARLRQETRLELEHVLSAFQMEEYLLRYSYNAETLRNELGELKYFNATPDEFRAIFRATDNIDLQLAQLANATDVSSLQLRTALQAQRENALKVALGADRYEQYRLLDDPGYRVAYAAAVRAGDPDSALTLYEINQAAAQEQTRLRANTNFTSEQLAVEIKKAELEQLKAVAQALGQELPPEPPPPPKPQPRKIHKLSPGENLAFLSRLYGVNPDALRAANPNLNLDRLKPGDTVSVPINLLPPVPFLPPQ